MVRIQPHIIVGKSEKQICTTRMILITIKIEVLIELSKLKIERMVFYYCYCLVVFQQYSYIWEDYFSTKGGLGYSPFSNHRKHKGFSSSRIN